MIPSVAVLRPEPGNHDTVQRACALGLHAVALPLFKVQPLPWIPPDLGVFDSLILTSANAVRWAGAGLDLLIGLPVVAVGEATADAARAAGFNVVITGTGNAATALADAAAAGITRALHLGGRESMVTAQGVVQSSIAVYASVPVKLAPAALAGLSDHVVLLHSSRAARWLATQINDTGVPRHQITIAGFSQAVAGAAGVGWKTVMIAPVPTDDALLRIVVGRVTGD